MATIRIIDGGNIFSSTCQTLVNTVNCVGVMGAGLALECRLRYPTMYQDYVKMCEAGHIASGELRLYQVDDRWILNFPTKAHWRYPTPVAFLHAGMQKFVETWEEQKIESIAFPLLGAQHGGMHPDDSQDLMLSYLDKCHCEVEIYKHDPAARDDWIKRLESTVEECVPAELGSKLGLSTTVAENIRNTIVNRRFGQVSQLSSVDGIGMKTIERIYEFLRADMFEDKEAVQLRLDFDSAE